MLNPPKKYQEILSIFIRIGHNRREIRIGHNRCAITHLKEKLKQIPFFPKSGHGNKKN